MYTITPEQDRLVERARQGDAAAFGRLYEQVYTDLFRYALYALGSREEAEDAVQEAVLEAFRGIGGLKNAQAFRGWIFTILSARCNRHVAGLIARRKETDIDELPLAAADFSPACDTAMRLREAIATLREDDRRLVLLSVVGGFSGHEIAALLHRPEGTLRSRLHRTLQKLRILLENDTDGKEEPHR